MQKLKYLEDNKMEDYFDWVFDLDYHLLKMDILLAQKMKRHNLFFRKEADLDIDHPDR